MDWPSLADIPIIRTENYGILTLDDYASDVDQFYEYDTMRWLCIPTSKVYLGCTSDGIDSYTGTHMAELEFTVQEGPLLIHHFGHRRGTDMEGCLAYVREWTRIMSGEQNVCILGSRPHPHISMWNDQPILEYGWLLYRVKTKKGCDEWGVDFDCSIRVPQDLKYAPGTVSEQ
jgi:hypothetical protein